MTVYPIVLDTILDSVKINERFIYSSGDEIPLSAIVAEIASSYGLSECASLRLQTIAFLQLTSAEQNRQAIVDTGSDTLARVYISVQLFGVILKDSFLIDILSSPGEIYESAAWIVDDHNLGEVDDERSTWIKEVELQILQQICLHQEALAKGKSLPDIFSLKQTKRVSDEASKTGVYLIANHLDY